VPGVGEPVQLGQDGMTGTGGGRRRRDGLGGLDGYPAGAVPPMTVADLSDGGGWWERDPLGPIPLVAVADLADCGRGERHPLGAGPLVAVDDLPHLGRLRRLAHTLTIVRPARILARILEVEGRGAVVSGAHASTGLVVGMAGVTEGFHGWTGVVVVLRTGCGLITTTTSVEP